MGGSGGRLALWLVALAVLIASGATGVVVVRSGPPANGGPSGQVSGSARQRLDGDRKATAPAQPGTGAPTPAGGSTGLAAGSADRYNVGAAHSPELLRDLAGPLSGTGSPSGAPGGPSARTPAGDRARGLDVAADQHPGDTSIDWPAVAAAGYSFAAVKTTEGDYYANPWYTADTTGAQAAGLQVTGYHVAIPNVSGGAAQAGFAVRHLGRLRALELDVEYDPYVAIDHTNQCYGLSARQLVSWIGAFTGEAERLTGHAPVIYTTAAWWRACTGDSGAFGSDPLWVAGYGPGQPARPGAWGSWSWWQFTSAGTVPGVPAGRVDVSYAESRRTAPFSPAGPGGAVVADGANGANGADGPGGVGGLAGVAGVTGGAAAGLGDAGDAGGLGGSGGDGGSGGGGSGGAGSSGGAGGSQGEGGSGGAGGLGGRGGVGGSGASGGKTTPVPSAAASPVSSAPVSLVVPASKPPPAVSPGPVTPTGP